MFDEAEPDLGDGPTGCVPAVELGCVDPVIDPVDPVALACPPELAVEFTGAVDPVCVVEVAD